MYRIIQRVSDMIIWNEKMYVTDSVRGDLKEIQKKIEKPEKLRFGAYLITLCDNGPDLLEIYDILLFPAKHYKKAGADIEIVGVALNSEEAKELAGKIVTHVYNKTGDFDVKSWFRG